MSGEIIFVRVVSDGESVILQEDESQLLSVPDEVPADFVIPSKEKEGNLPETFVKVEKVTMITYAGYRGVIKKIADLPQSVRTIVNRALRWEEKYRKSKQILL
jgi:hypothetical protein